MISIQKTSVTFQAKPDPIKLIEIRQKYCATVEKKYRLIIRETLVFAKEFVLELWQSEDLRDRFMAHPFWNERPYKVNSGRLPLLSMQFILGVKKAEGAAYEKARIYAKIVEHYLEANASSEAMLDDLRKMTIAQAINRSNIENSKQNPVRSTEITADENAPALTHQAECAVIESAKAMRSKRRPNYPFDPATQIAIEMSENDRILLLNLSYNEIKSVKIRRIADNGQWVKLQAVVIRRRQTR